MVTRARSCCSSNVPLRTPPQRRPLASSDREATILRHDGLARRVASWYSHSSVDPEDILVAARYGLILAVDGFDVQRGTQFSTYATWKIRNACEAELRSQGVYHSGRNRRHRLYEAAVDGLRALRHGATGKTREDAIGALNAWREWVANPSGRPAFVSLDESLHEGQNGWEVAASEEPSPEAIAVDRWTDSERSRVLRDGLRQLSRRQRHILVRYYLCGWPIAQVSREIGMRAIMAQQIRDAGLERLRERLEWSNSQLW